MESSSSSDKSNEGVRQKFESMYREISGKMKELAGKDETAADILQQLHQAKEFVSRHLGESENKIALQDHNDSDYDEEVEEEGGHDREALDDEDEDEDEGDEGEENNVEWVQYIDEATGVPYYSNLATGEVQWEKPFKFFIDQSVLDYQDKGGGDDEQTTGDRSPVEDGGGILHTKRCTKRCSKEEKGLLPKKKKLHLRKPVFTQICTLEPGLEGVNLICRCVGVGSGQQQSKNMMTKRNKPLSCFVCGKKDPIYTKTENSFCSAKCYLRFKKGITKTTTGASGASESKEQKPKKKKALVSSPTSSSPSSPFMLEEARLADQTGSILIPLPTEELRDIVVSGAALIVRNAHVRVEKNKSIRLIVDKWGLVERYDTKWGYAAPDPVKTLKLDAKSNKSFVSGKGGKGGGGGGNTSPLSSKATEKLTQTRKGNKSRSTRKKNVSASRNK